MCGLFFIYFDTIHPNLVYTLCPLDNIIALCICQLVLLFITFKERHVLHNFLLFISSTSRRRLARDYGKQYIIRLIKLFWTDSFDPKYLKIFISWIGNLLFVVSPFKPSYFVKYKKLSMISRKPKSVSCSILKRKWQ